jgi:hypothetical protein
VSDGKRLGSSTYRGSYSWPLKRTKRPNGASLVRARGPQTPKHLQRVLEADSIRSCEPGALKHPNTYNTFYKRTRFARASHGPSDTQTHTTHSKADSLRSCEPGALKHPKCSQPMVQHIPTGHVHRKCLQIIAQTYPREVLPRNVCKTWRNQCPREVSTRNVHPDQSGSCMWNPKATLYEQYPIPEIT